MWGFARRSRRFIFWKVYLLLNLHCKMTIVLTFEEKKIQAERDKITAVAACRRAELEV